MIDAATCCSGIWPIELLDGYSETEENIQQQILTDEEEYMVCVHIMLATLQLIFSSKLSKNIFPYYCAAIFTQICNYL